MKAWVSVILYHHWINARLSEEWSTISLTGPDRTQVQLSEEFQRCRNEEVQRRNCSRMPFGSAEDLDLLS